MSKEEENKIDIVKAKYCRESLRLKYFQEAEQAWKLSILRQGLSSAGKVNADAQKEKTGKDQPIERGTETKDTSPHDVLSKWKDTFKAESSNEEFNFLLNESKVALEELLKDEPIGKRHQKAEARIRCLIVLVNMQHQQIARQTGTQEHLALCKAVEDKKALPQITLHQKNSLGEIETAKTKMFPQSKDQSKQMQEWDSIAEWMEDVEVFHKYYLQISALEKLEVFQNAYLELKKCYVEAFDNAEDRMSQPQDLGESLKQFCLDARIAIFLLRHHTRMHCESTKGRRDSMYHNERQDLIHLLPNISKQKCDKADEEYWKEFCKNLQGGGTHFERLKECHELVSVMTTQQTTIEKSDMSAHLNAFMDSINWDDINNCMRCKEVAYITKMNRALNSGTEYLEKDVRKYILSYLDWNYSSQEREAVKLHKEAYDVLKTKDSLISRDVGDYLLRLLEKRHRDCKGKGSFSQLAETKDSPQSGHPSNCEDCMKSFEARKELNSLRADESLSHEDSRLHLFNILEDPSSCENCNEILLRQDAYQHILESKPLSSEQKELLLSIFPDGAHCNRCSEVGLHRLKKGTKDEEDIGKKLREELEKHDYCKKCKDTLLCMDTYKEITQERRLSEEMRDFISNALSNVEDQWKCEDISNNCITTFWEVSGLEGAGGRLPDSSRSRLIEDLKKEIPCELCETPMLDDISKALKDCASLEIDQNQIDILKKIIMQNACKGCDMLMDQIKVRKTLQEGKVLSSNLRKILCESILPASTQCKECHQWMDCMTTLKKLQDNSALNQVDQERIKHICDKTKNCQAEGCQATYDGDVNTADEEAKLLIKNIWKAGLECKDCHEKLLHCTDVKIDSTAAKKHQEAMECIKDHLSEEQRTKCYVCEGFYVPPDPLILRRPLFDKIVIISSGCSMEQDQKEFEQASQTRLKEQDLLNKTFRYPLVMNKKRDRKSGEVNKTWLEKGSQQKKGKGRGGSQGKQNNKGRQADNESTVTSSQRLPSDSTQREALGEQSSDVTDVERQTGTTSQGVSRRGGGRGKCEWRNGEGKEGQGMKNKFTTFAKKIGNKIASGGRGTGFKGKGKDDRNLEQTAQGVVSEVSNGNASSGQLDGKESVVSRGEEEHHERVNLDRKRKSFDKCSGMLGEKQAIDDIAQSLQRWSKVHEVPLCILTNYKYSDINNGEGHKSITLITLSKGEIDIVIFSRHLGIILIEVKAIHAAGTNLKKGLRKAKEQLEKDEWVMFEMNRDWLGDKNIPVTLLLALPYTHCSRLRNIGLCHLDSSRIITKCDLLQVKTDVRKLDKFIGIPKTNEFSIQDNDYCRLVERFYGLTHMIEAPYLLSKGIRAVGSEMFFSLLTEDQKTLLKSENIPYQALAGDYGTGKSLMLVFKAREIAKEKIQKNERNAHKSVFMVSCTDITVDGEHINLDQPDLSMRHLKKLTGSESKAGRSYFDHIEYFMAKDFLESTPNLKPGIDLAQTLGAAIQCRASEMSELHIFLDEIPLNLLTKFKEFLEELVKDKEGSKLGKSIKTFWFSIATHSFRVDVKNNQDPDWVQSECPESFNFMYLRQNLRVPFNTKKLHKLFEESMSDGHVDTEMGDIPPGPRPLLYRVPKCVCRITSSESVTNPNVNCLNCDCSQIRMTETLRRLFIKLGVLTVRDQLTTKDKWPGSIVMLLTAVTDSKCEKEASKLLIESCNKLNIFVEDKICTTSIAMKTLSKEKDTCQKQDQEKDLARVDNQNLHVPHVLTRSLSTGSDNALDFLEGSNISTKPKDESKTTQSTPIKPNILLTNETAFIGCEAWVLIYVDLNAMLHSFSSSKLGFTTCAISRCLSQYVHFTWHDEEAKSTFKKLMESETYKSIVTDSEIEQALNNRPTTLEMFLEQHGIDEEKVELPAEMSEC
ncbi:uncharacterized protein [Apostichopus japonicus]